MTENNANLCSYAAVKEMMGRHGLSPRKNLGQNFLIDPHVLNKIITAGDLSQDDLVIEIGPGLGVLTRELAKRAGKVCAIEIDKGIIPILEENTACFNNVEIINSDVLKTDIPGLMARMGKGTVKVIANLPYYITTPILFALLEEGPGISSITVMVQKEVGERMKASPSHKAYGALSVIIRYYAHVDLVANVPSNCFYPRPDVDSAVIKLNIWDKPPVEVTDKDLLFRVVKSAFSMRRKTLVNCLVKDFAISKEDAAAVLARIGLRVDVRGESLGLEDFRLLSNELIQHI